MPKIEFVDVTNRDGDQTAQIVCSKLQKTMINWMLDQMGVYQSELGFPLSPHETNYINANVELTQECPANNGPLIEQMQLSGWSRALASDVKIAQERTALKHFNLSISTSEQMLQWKFRGRFSKQDIIRMMVDAVTAAKEGGAVTAGINAEDASRTDLDFLIEFAQAGKEVGAARFRYCDTLGYDDPVSIAERISIIAKEVQMPIELHCHNDLGMAVANSCAAAVACCRAGQDAFINTTVNGLGERAGNADLVACVLALQYSSQWADENWVTDRINLSKAYRLATYVSNAYGVPIPINQPGVGANAFAHESGIHADGALKDRHNYELYDYECLGRGELCHSSTGRVITAGAHSGASGLEYVYNQLDLGFSDEEHKREILKLVQLANLHNQAPLTREELWFIYHCPEIAAKVMTVIP
ncbi:MAG: homocitrate synthase [candidate division WS1 bacterium]|jgi:homocitrate synthase NifV|nr:homocitrate synthase [candidate division WS1 bacterium]